MAHVEANLPADFSEYFSSFTRLGYRLLKEIAAMERADVPDVLDSDMLALDGTIERQKQRLFD